MIASKLLAAMTCLALAAPAPVPSTDDTRSHGGSGGGQYRVTCAHGSFLVGIGGRTGDWVDAILPICASWDAVTKGIGPPVPGEASGGAGGSPASVLCPQGTAVKGVEVVATDNDGQILVRYARLRCQSLDQLTQGRMVSGGKFGGGGDGDGSLTDAFDCPRGHLANGVHGRSGEYVDRVGLACEYVPFHLGDPAEAPAPIDRTSSAIPRTSGTDTALRATPALPVAVPLGEPLARVAGETYASPRVVAADGRMLSLDFCREFGSGCGKPAADSYCRQQGYSAASGFRIQENVGLTAIISSGEICNDPSCDTFDKIECGR